MPQFHTRRRKAAQEIVDAADRYRQGQPIGYDEIAGVLLEHQRTIVSSLIGSGCWCEKCERVVIPVDAGGDDLCPHCNLVL